MEKDKTKEESRLSPTTWRVLLSRIKAGLCTPFLGAGACDPVLPLGSTIAQAWAKEFGYPLGDPTDLARVAQYLFVMYDPVFPKETIRDQFFQDLQPPDFEEGDEPHGVLASLPLPIYMTTNYDDFMVRALQAHGKDPKREFCCWNRHIKNYSSVLKDESGFEPTPDNPVVYHLHGHSGVLESMVLAEADYLDFLANIHRPEYTLPPRIQAALAETSLLFIGYKLEDWSFRVIFQGIIDTVDPHLRRVSVTVQLPPTDTEGPKSEQQEYLVKYFDKMDVQIYWGTAREFAADLRKHWKEFSGSG